jgi:hypothetical protein
MLLNSSVFDKIGAMAYKFELPASSSIHPFFHVSQLKTMIPSTHAVSALPQNLDSLTILQRRLQVFTRRKVLSL